MESKENKRTKVILAALAGLLVIIIAVVAFTVVRGSMKESSYTAVMEEAEKYLAENDYDQAIIEYQNAIDIDPEQDEPYLALADIYVEQENLSRAKSILRKGYENTESFKIQRMLSSLEGRTLTGGAGEEIEEENLDLSTASQNIAWDSSFMQKIVDYTFDDYKNEFGQVVSAEMDDEGYLEVRHSKLNATCYYRNTSDNKKIVDNSRKVPYATGMPEKITLDSLDILFRNFDGGASLNRMQMLFGERVEPKTLEGNIYIEMKEEDLVVRLGTDSEGNIISPASWNELILPLANTKEATAGTLSGVVVDAVSGKGVANASLTFQPKSSGGKTVKKTTNSKGAFRAELEADDYEITIEASGYISEVFTFTIEKGKSYSGEQFVISPELTGEARIVLEWGAQPTDLDSYLNGSVDDADDIWVYYGDRQASSDGNVIAELDLDDRDGYGPETTTIYDLNGVYRFTVADFFRTGTMAQNGATVKVYLPGQSPVTIQLDPGLGEIDVWDVCVIDHGSLEILNRENTDYGSRDSHK